MKLSKHISCALSILRDLKEHKDRTISREEIAKSLKEKKEYFSNSILASACRELLKNGVLVRKGRNYQVNTQQIGPSEKKLETSQKKIDINKVKEILGKYKILSRREINNLLPMYNTLQVDRILPDLRHQGFIAKLNGDKTRGKYVVTPGGEIDLFISDSINAAASLFGEAVIFCYNTALEIHGFSRYGMSSVIYIHGRISQEVSSLGEAKIKSVKLCSPGTGTIIFNRVGQNIRLTDVERTFIDCVHRSKYAVGWENVLYGLKKVELLNGERVLEYLKEFRIPSLFAKMGIIFEYFQDKWKIERRLLNRLRMYCPSTPIRFFRNEPGKINKRWNIYEPEGLFEIT